MLGAYAPKYSPMPDYVPAFVSGKEHYKATPQLVKDFVESLDIHVDVHRYLNFQTIDRIGDREDYYGVLILASPDVLSGLVSWACYDNTNPDAVCAPWGSGCSSTLRAVMTWASSSMNLKCVPVTSAERSGRWGDV